MDAELLQEALAARENAYAPYSGFRVGAALRSQSGQVIRGCNIENAALGLSMCAERVALFQALSQGQVPVTEIMVVAAPSPEPVTPCGACRQVMAELAPDARVYLANEDGSRVRETTVGELLPLPFQR